MQLCSLFGHLPEGFQDVEKIVTGASLFGMGIYHMEICNVGYRLLYRSKSPKAALCPL